MSKCLPRLPYLSHLPHLSYVMRNYYCMMKCTTISLGCNDSLLHCDVMYTITLGWNVLLFHRGHRPKTYLLLHQLYSPILCTTFFCLIRRNRSQRTHAICLQSICRDFILCYKFIHHSLSP